MPESTENKAVKIFQKRLADLPSSQRPQVRALLLTRIGVHQEVSPQVDIHTVSKTWEQNSLILEEMVNQDPKEAIKFGIFLVNLPKHSDPEIDLYNRYLHGIGMEILINESLCQQASNYINTGKDNQKLVNNIKSFLSLDVAGWNKDRVFSEPESFNLITALILGLSLGKDSQVSTPGREIFEMAREKIKDSNTMQVVNYFKELEDTEPLHQRLMKLAQESTS